MDARTRKRYAASMARNDDLAEAGGDLLNRVLAYRGISPTQLARRIDISPRSVRAYINGDTLPSKHNAFAVAVELDSPELLDAWGMSELRPGPELWNRQRYKAVRDRLSIDGGGRIVNMAMGSDGRVAEPGIHYEALPSAPTRMPLGSQVTGRVIGRIDETYVIQTSTGMLLKCERIAQAEWLLDTHVDESGWQIDDEYRD